eukprot:maker-scaffold90_size386344-snap-gene-1.19 protein:Tk12042 transcript:maker-scaffold90_size386344-snap-gene-1.19-mRNA-1 annotation:"adrenodoxin-like mitochondrial-like"
MPGLMFTHSLRRGVRSLLASRWGRHPVFRAATEPLGLRALGCGPVLSHGDEGLRGRPDTIEVHFILKDGSRRTVLGKEGERALYLAHRYDIAMEGACEASLACTTCHCYVEEGDYFERLPEATDQEEDLLDEAPFLSVNSRLGCQIILTPELHGIVLRLPRATKNFYVDGHVPQPH